ncbi:MAG TPA: hypothetical protein GX530_08040 [Corynebacteriales bacterium]|nr:hypothetical protein [Mycobacteriales bacterium]
MAAGVTAMKKSDYDASHSGYFNDIKNQIYNYSRENQNVSIKDLARRFNVSYWTAKRYRRPAPGEFQRKYSYKFLDKAAELLNRRPMLRNEDVAKKLNLTKKEFRRVMEILYRERMLRPRLDANRTREVDRLVLELACKRPFMTVYEIARHYRIDHAHVGELIQGLERSGFDRNLEKKILIDEVLERHPGASEEEIAKQLCVRPTQVRRYKHYKVKRRP